MPKAVGRDLLESYSRGEMTRREIAEQLGQPVSFGQLLGLLQENRLPLPRIAVDPDAPGVKLVRELAIRAARDA